MLHNWTSFLQLHSEIFKIVQCRANICLKTMQSLPSPASHFGIKFKAAFARLLEMKTLLWKAASNISLFSSAVFPWTPTRNDSYISPSLSCFEKQGSTGVLEVKWVWFLYLLKPAGNSLYSAPYRLRQTQLKWSGWLRLLEPLCNQKNQFQDCREYLEEAEQ